MFDRSVIIFEVFSVEKSCNYTKVRIAGTEATAEGSSRGEGGSGPSLYNSAEWAALKVPNESRGKAGGYRRVGGEYDEKAVSLLRPSPSVYAHTHF